MDLHAWGAQRARYSRARRGRHERGASLVECALIQGITQAMAIRQAGGSTARPSPVATASDERREGSRPAA